MYVCMCVCMYVCCVCVCMYACVCMYVCIMYVCMYYVCIYYVCMYVCIMYLLFMYARMCTYVCIYVCMYLCIMYVYVCVCMYARTYVCMYLCMYVCAYVCMYVQSDQKVSVHPMITVQKTRKNILNNINHHDNVVSIRDNKYREHSSACQQMSGDTLNITCNFLYCNRQAHRDFLITLYKADAAFLSSNILL
jgi:hypothetical protein